MTLVRHRRGRDQRPYGTRARRYILEIVRSSRTR